MLRHVPYKAKQAKSYWFLYKHMHTKGWLFCDFDICDGVRFCAVYILIKRIIRITVCAITLCGKTYAV